MKKITFFKKNLSRFTNFFHLRSQPPWLERVKLEAARPPTFHQQLSINAAAVASWVAVSFSRILKLKMWNAVNSTTNSHKIFTKTAESPADPAPDSLSTADCGRMVVAVGLRTPCRLRTVDRLTADGRQMQTRLPPPELPCRSFARNSFLNSYQNMN